MITGVIYLRYDLAVSISPISSLGRCRSHLRHNSLDLQSSSLGSPPASTILWRDYRATGTVRAILPCHAGGGSILHFVSPAVLGGASPGL